MLRNGFVDCGPGPIPDLGAGFYLAQSHLPPPSRVCAIFDGRAGLEVQGDSKTQLMARNHVSFLGPPPAGSSGYLSSCAYLGSTLGPGPSFWCVCPAPSAGGSWALTALPGATETQIIRGLTAAAGATGMAHHGPVPWGHRTQRQPPGRNRPILASRAERRALAARLWQGQAREPGSPAAPSWP